MMLTAKQIASFQDIWRNEFGQELSRAAAEQHATVLLRLVRVLRDTSYIRSESV